MDNISLIITAVFLTFIALAALIGYGKGKKYVWQYTLTRLIINVLAVAIAIPVTRILSMKIVDSVFETLLAGELDSEGSIFNNLTIAVDIAKTLAAMMIGLFLFFFVRLVVKFFLKFFKYTIFSLINSLSDLICKKGSKNGQKSAKAAKNNSAKPEFNVSLVTAPAANKAYKFCFRDGKKNNVTSYFLDGNLYKGNNGQHATVIDPATAANVYIVPTEANSEYCYLKVENANGVKYINVICDANGNVNAFLGDTSVTEYIYDGNLGTLITVVNDETYVLAADKSDAFVYAETAANAANIPYVRFVEVERNPDAVSTEEFATDDGDAVIVESIQPRKNKKPRKKDGCYALKPQLASILIGIFGCIFGVVVVFAPFTGLIGLVNNTLTTVTTAMGEDTIDDEETLEMLEMVTDITGNFSVKFSNFYGGKLIFNRLTTYKVNDTKIKLKNEVNLVTTIAGSGMTIINEDSDKNAKKDAVEDILDAFDKSSIIPLILADIVNQAATAIENGDEFMGIINADNDDDRNNGDDYYDDYYGDDYYGKPETDDDDEDTGDAMSEMLISEIVSSFKGCTPDSIKEDVRTVGNIVIIFIEHDAITTLTDDPEGILKAKDLITDLLEAFFDNDRISSLVSTFVEFGIGMLEDQLGMTETLEEPYAKMKAELMAIDQSYSAEDNTKLVADIFYKYGIDITDDGARSVALKLKQSTNIYTGSVNMETVLSSVAVNGKNTPVNLSTLAGFEAESLLITKSEIVITHKNSVSNPKKEAQNIAGALFAITDLTGSMEDGDELQVSAILSTVGEILDRLADTEIVGKDVVDKLLLVMFQSEELGENLPMNTVQITNFVNSLIASSGKNGYAAVMGGIGDMVDALSKLSESEDIDSVEALGDVLETITPETAEALKYFATTDFVGDLGVEDESAEGVANVLGTLFDELATTELTGDAYKEEARKVADLLDVTMSISDGSSDGSDVSFEDFVGSVMDSQILTNTVINSVCDDNGNVTNKDPLNTGMELDADDKQELVDSLQTKLNENKTEANKKLVVAIAAYMNVDVHVTSDGTIVAD